MKMVLLCALMVVLCAAALPQAGSTITGSVLAKDTRKPLRAANVSVVGTTIGTTTGEAGEFTIGGLQDGNYEIRFSFVGYISDTRSVTIGGAHPVTIEVLLLPSLIYGQPITVTATRGRERETPATFSTLAQQDIRERYSTQDIPVLLSELPSMTFYSESGNNIGYTYLNIRGFDARRIAVMVNGIPQNDPEDHNVYWLDMPDLASSAEDIQVQRGAGSAFYGSPAIGGSVNLVTSHFGRERSLRLSAGTGSFNTRKYSASFSSGLIDNRYAVHARVSKILSSGYRDRAWIDFSSYFFGAIRYDESMTTQVNVYGGPISDGLAYYGIPKSDVVDLEKRRANPIQRPEEIENFSQPHIEFLHEWRLSPSITLNNTAFIMLGDGFFDYDGSWAPYSYYRITPEYGIPVEGDPDTLYLPGALIRAQVTNRQYGWLPRLTLRHDRGETVIGAELRVHRSLHWGRLQWAAELPAGVPFDYRYYQYRGAKDIASLYVHSLYDVSSTVKLMLDLHYAYNSYRLFEEKFVGTEFTVPYHFVNPRLGLNYNIDQRWNTYVSLAYTSREPRLKNLYDAAEASTPASWGAVVPQFAVDEYGQLDFSRPLVKPESLFNLELGTGFSSDAVRVAVSAYWMEFTDEIVKSGQVDRFGQPITGNAERTRHVGVELSGRAELGSGFEMVGNATVSRNMFIRHTDYQTETGVSLDGNPIAGFPSALANVRLTYRLEDFSASIAGRYVGKQYTDNYRNEMNTVDPFFVSSLWASYTVRKLLNTADIEMRVHVENLFNTLYAAYGEGEQFFVGAERSVFFNIAVIL